MSFVSQIEMVVCVCERERERAVLNFCHLKIE